METIGKTLGMSNQNLGLQFQMMSKPVNSNCKKCNVVLTKENTLGPYETLCNTCNEEKRKEEVRVNRENRVRSTIPPMYLSASVDEISPDIISVALKGPCFIWGPAGTGKTYTMFAVMKERIRNGDIIKWITFNDLLLRIRATFNSKSNESETETEIINFYRNVDVLYIDDLGTITDRETDFSARVLLSILDYRVMYCKDTYFTSNQSIEQIKDSFDDRIFSRIAGHCQIIKLTGKDRRLNGNSQSGQLLTGKE